MEGGEGFRAARKGGCGSGVGKEGGWRTLFGQACANHCRYNHGMKGSRERERVQICRSMKDRVLQKA